MLAWFTTSRTGQIIAAIGLALAVGAVALLKAFAAGQAKERLRGVEANLTATRERRKVEQQVSSRPAATNRDRLKEWGRK